MRRVREELTLKSLEERPPSRSITVVREHSIKMWVDAFAKQKVNFKNVGKRYFFIVSQPWR